MNEDKVDRSIPIPKNGKGRKQKYDFSNMTRVGDSRWFPLTCQNLITIFKGWCGRNKKKWMGRTAKEEKNGVPGARIWRIK